MAPPSSPALALLPCRRRARVGAGRFPATAGPSSEAGVSPLAAAPSPTRSNALYVLHLTTGLKERSLISQARMYLGAEALLAERGRTKRRTRSRSSSSTTVPEPPPLSFPTDTINTFIDVRSLLLEQIKGPEPAAARLAAETRLPRGRRARGAAGVAREGQGAGGRGEDYGAEQPRGKLGRCRSASGSSRPGAGCPRLGFPRRAGAALGGTIVTAAMYRYSSPHREADDVTVDDRVARQWGSSARTTSAS